MNRRKMLEESFRGLTRALWRTLPAMKGWIEGLNPILRPVGK